MIIAKPGGDLNLIANSIRRLTVQCNTAALRRRRVDDREVCVVGSNKRGVFSKSRRLLKWNVLIEQIRSTRPFQGRGVTGRRGDFKLLRKDLDEVPVAPIIVDDRNSIDRGEVAIDGVLIYSIVRLIRSLRRKVKSGTGVARRERAVEDVIHQFRSRILIYSKRCFECAFSRT